MYSENVTEIIDDLMFDERCLDREEMKREGIRLLLEANLSAASSGNRHYCKPFYSGKPMDVAREYYDPDASEEDVIGFYDNTLFGKGTEGVLFCADGMFPSFLTYLCNIGVLQKQFCNSIAVFLPFSTAGLLPKRKSLLRQAPWM